MILTPGLDNLGVRRVVLVGFDVKHGQCGGPADQAGFAVVAFDGQGGVGDVDGDGWCGWILPGSPSERFDL